MFGPLWLWHPSPQPGASSREESYLPALREPGERSLWGSETRCRALTGLFVCCLVIDDLRVPLLSILYQVVRCLLGLIAVLVRRDVAKDAEASCPAPRERRAATSSRPGALCPV